MKNNILLVLTALIWGCAFVAQSVGMDYVGPFTFNMARFLIGAIVLLPVIWFMDRQRKTGAEKGAGQKTLIIGGICCGIALAVASTLQQWGILFTTVGKAGFITAMYIVIVPLLGIFIGKKVRPLIIGCVAIAVVGFYFLCMTESLRLGLGDFLVLLCAIVNPYSGDRSFFTESGWRENVRDPVSDSCDHQCSSNSAMGAAGVYGDPAGMAAGALCRCNVLWSGVYPADHSAEKCRSDSSLPASQSGVRVLGTGWLGTAGTGTES